jgi:hypothetical protein
MQVIMSVLSLRDDSMDRLVWRLTKGSSTYECAFQPRLAARIIIGSSAEFPRAAHGETSV